MRHFSSQKNVFIRETNQIVNSKSWLLRPQTSQVFNISSTTRLLSGHFHIASIKRCRMFNWRAPIKHSALQEIHPLYSTVLSWLLNKNDCRTFYLPRCLYLERMALANSSLQDRSNGTDAGLFALRRPQPLANSSTVTHGAPEPR